METLTADQFKKRFGESTYNSFPEQQKAPAGFGTDAAIGFAKGVGDTVTETANMFVEGGRMLQAGLNPNKTYGEMSQEADARSDSRPAWVNPFSGQAEDSRREMLASDNKAQLFGKGAAFGAELLVPTRGAVNALSKGDDAVEFVRNTMRKQTSDKPNFSRERIGSVINRYRAQLSDIDPQYETVLKQQQTPDKMVEYFETAEKAAVDASQPMATTIASKRGIEAYEAIGTGLEEAGKAKGAILDSISDVKIGGNITGRSIDDVKSVVEQRYGMIINADGTLTQAPGRVAKLDGPSQKLITEYITGLRNLGMKPTAQQLDDFVDAMQAKLYKQSSPNLFEVADTPVVGFLKQTTGAINGQLKSNVDSVVKQRGGEASYSELNEQYARLIRAQEDLNKALGNEGDKGASLMKSLFSPQTGERTRRIFQTVYDETGINLFEEATLAKFAMESVGDPRSQSLLKQLDDQIGDVSKLNLMEPGSWLNFAREKVDLDGKALGEQIIKQNTDNAATKADEAAKTVDDFFEPEPKKSMGQKIKSVLTDQTGSAKNPLGSGETDLQRLGRLRVSSANLNRMKPEALDRVEEYMDHMAGVEKKTGDDLVNLKADIQLIAETIGVDATGSDAAVEKALREVLDSRLANRTTAISGKAPSATSKTTDTPAITQAVRAVKAKVGKPSRVESTTMNFQGNQVPAVKVYGDKGWFEVTEKNITDAGMEVDDFKSRFQPTS